MWGWGLIISAYAGLLVTMEIYKSASRNLDSHRNKLHLSYLPPMAHVPAVTVANANEAVIKSKKAVLILFGVPKHFRLVLRSYMKNIVQRNPQMKFEVYIHMYSDLHLQPFSSDRNGETNAQLDSPDDIRAILFDELGGNVSKLLTTSSQSIFEELELSWLQQNDTSFFDVDYPFQTLQNMFRQGNSLREAFFSFQKHNNSWNGNNDWVCIFARSDTFLMDAVDIPSGIGNNDVVVPRWTSAFGYNDRFAVAGSDSAKVYATKIVGYKEAILTRRSKPEAELESLRNSETLLKKWLVENKVNVTERENLHEWGLLRLRADGQIANNDLGEFDLKEKNISHVEHLHNVNAPLVEH